MSSTWFCYTLLCWIPLQSSGFKYANDDGGYNFCWTIPFHYKYEVHQVRLQAIDAIKKGLNASFCDISYVQTVDPWLKHNQTRYKIFVIADGFKDKPIHKRVQEIKNIVYPILSNPGDHRVDIVARNLEEQPSGNFTELEMKYNIYFLDREEMPIFGGNRLKRDAEDPPVKEFTMAKPDKSWKFHPNKTCRLVEERIRQKFDPVYYVKCTSMVDELRGKVAPGHEDQYKVYVVSQNFVGQAPLRRNVNVKRALIQLITTQMHKIHMTLKTVKEHEADLKNNNATTTDDLKNQ